MYRQKMFYGKLAINFGLVSSGYIVECKILPWKAFSCVSKPEWKVKKLLQKFL